MQITAIKAAPTAISDNRRIRVGASWKPLPVTQDSGRIRVGASWKPIPATQDSGRIRTGASWRPLPAPSGAIAASLTA